MIFHYFTNYASSGCICRKPDFERLIHSPNVKKLIAAFRAGNPNAKKNLPAFCFQAILKNGKRNSQSAESNGAVALDCDHMPEDILHEVAQLAIPVKGEEDRSPVLLVHITPSGKGLRVVFKATKTGDFANCRTIGDYQRVMARRLHAEKYLDEVCTDLPRLSFCPQAEDVLYLSDRLFTDQQEVVVEADSHHPSSPRTAMTPEARQLFAESTQDTFEGLPLRDIFTQYLQLTGGLPQEGSRNSRFYSAARDLRYICDFNPYVVATHLPDCGLPPSEVLQVCNSACQSSRGTKTPEDVLKAIALTKALQQGDSEVVLYNPEEEVEDYFTNKAHYIPRPFIDFLTRCPADFREATLMSLLPILGTLATSARAVYLDGELHSPTFFTIINSEQASGKSFARRLVRQLLHTLEEEDEIEREVERKYREEVRRKKNAKELPPEPKVKIRIVPASISIAKFLQRMDNAEGEHLFSFAEELDILSTTNRAGAWSNKFELYRIMFDNGRFGQDYISDASYSANLNVYYNLLVLGTPRQTDRFFMDVENGLASRCCLGSIADQFGADLPHFEPFDEKATLRIEHCVKTLREARGQYDLNFLHPVLHSWLNTQRIRALQENNRARDIFRRRSAVIGFRAVLTVAPLYNLKDKEVQEKLSEFSVMVANIVLRNQLNYFGERINKIVGEKVTFRPNRWMCKSVYDSLPDEFTAQQVDEELRQRGMRTPAKQTLWSWKKNTLIEPFSKDGKTFYRKLNN